MVKLTLDTCCVIAAMTEGDQDHEAVNELDALARRGSIELSVVSSALAYDQENDSNEDRRASRQSWLDERPYILRHSSGFTLNTSKLDSGDFLLSDEASHRLAAIDRVLAMKPRDARRKRIDAHHLDGHVLAGNAIFVTRDSDDAFSRERRGRLADEAGVVVKTPDEAVNIVRSAMGDA